MLDIVIDGLKYKYVKSIFKQDKSYIAYSDDDTIYISEYVIIENTITLKEISDSDFLKIKEEMKL